ncbi:Spo75 protein [Maudiozyma humilis]|uniref:Spo75 protein n=1 Tax=Maudiozyma humilis TaxID=51915 RepID=A0AAV5RXR4_MAUHU|nr:Spo75 protein [Kazachstania humilis]
MNSNESNNQPLNKVHYPTNSSTLRELFFGRIINSTVSNIRSETVNVVPLDFLTTALISIGYVTLEGLLYLLLKCLFQKVYRPKANSCIVSAQTENRKKISWSTSRLRDMSDRDGYYFVRFLDNMWLYFVIISIVNVPILIPLHVGSNTGYKFTMDSLSMINVQGKYMFFHFFLCIFNVFVFHALFLNEIKNDISTIHDFQKNSNFQNVVYVSNLTKCLTEFSDLLKTDHQIKEICQIPKSSHLTYTKWKRAYVLEQEIEKIIFDIATERYFLNNKVELFNEKVTVNDFFSNIKIYLRFNQRKFTFILRTSIPRLRIVTGKSWYFNVHSSINGQELIGQSAFQSFCYEKLHQKLSKYSEIVNSLRRRPLITHIGQFGKWTINKQCLDKGLLEFHTPASAYTMSLMFNKLSPNIGVRTVLAPHPADMNRLSVVYSNKYVNFTVILVTGLISISIIIGWVVPVAFLGYVAYIPYITVTHLQPLFLRIFPSKTAKDIVTNIFPFVTLIFLTEIVPYIFRFLASLKGFATRAEVERNVQFWFFLFLYIHLFVVLTASSGISFVVERLMKNPNTIPFILATELPKSGAFFCSFIFLRCTSYFGGNLLRIVDLMRFIFSRIFRSCSPHYTVDQMKNLLVFQWGSIYALFSVLGCIGITYSIICPLILPISAISFFVVSLSFRYLFETQYISENVSDTRGKLYQETISQLYAGIYFMEFSLFGIFMLSDQYKLSIGIGILFVLSIASHIYMRKYINCLDLESVMGHSSQIIKDTDTPIEDDSQLAFFRIPGFKDRSAYTEVWVPTDKSGSIRQDIRYIKDRYDIDINDEMCVFDNCGGIDLY